MIGVIDYGASNLASVGNALDHLGVPWKLCAAPPALVDCDKLILPGVGHFDAAVRGLRARGLDDAIRDSLGRGAPLLGLCLGAQLLFEGSEEAPGTQGLCLMSGRVVRLRTRTVPHMGWNRAFATHRGSLFGAEEAALFYFAHSFVCEPVDAADIAAVARQDGCEFCVAIQRDRLFGVQFHPEKSADAGLALLRRFAEC